VRKLIQPDTTLAISLLLTLVLLASGCHVHMNGPKTPSAAQYRFEIDRVQRDIVYTEAGWPQTLQADLYLPRRRGPLPVVLMVHGGGWANRGRDDMTDISKELAQHGYAVFNLNYRFAPYYTYPAQFLDLQQALHWVSKHSGLYHFDLDRINAWGYSSGAHLAALLGGIDEQRLPEGALADLPRLRAVVAGGIPADLRKYDDSPLVERFIGGTHDELFKRYTEASPVYHVSAGDPAVFLYHGKLDFLVTTDQPRDYYDALLAAGVDAELYLHNWRGHGSMFLFGSDAEARAIDFLDRHNRAKSQLAVE
jgi:acetyl esterase/lipase